MDANLLFSTENPYSIILNSVFTEKSQKLAGYDCYTFIVNRKANKKQIAKAINFLYGVTILAVRVINHPATKVKGNKGWKHVSGYKKAMVSIKSGQVIDFEKLADSKK